MVKYTFESYPYEGYDILKDGQTMFPSDVCKELNKLSRKEMMEEVIRLFTKDSIYTGAVIEFEIRSNLGAEEEKLI